jgi:hypothetical protein
LAVVRVFVHTGLVEELMPVILVVIIAGAWIVILGPNLMKRRSQAAGGSNSISRFHRSLRVLEHSAPEPLVTPAFRLRSAGASGSERSSAYPEVSAVPVLTVVGAAQLPRPALAFLGDALPEASVREVGAGAAVPVRTYRDVDTVTDEGTESRRTGSELQPLDARSRQLVRHRRRTTLGIIALVFLSTLMIGFVPGAGDAWIVSVLSAVVLAAYVAVLVRLRRGAEERERKLHYLSPNVTPDQLPAGMPRIPVYMSGRYAHPSNQAVAAH